MRSWLVSAVELRLGKIRRRLAQDIVGLPKFPVLPLQGLQLGRHLSRHPRRTAVVALSLFEPFIEGLPGAANFGRDRDDCCPTRRMLALVIQTIRTARSRTSGENLFVVLLVI